ncbi:hypothetical protein B566_EDAN001097 [Ephemera danica]|nr:hypothetical protein B566_EDAN001097 [Ephemera danica]
MQLSSIVVVVVGFVLGLVYAQDKYTTKWDNVDLDQILGNQRLRDNYVKCLLDQGSCTPDGSELKRVLPEALQTDCAKCNEKQKQGGEKTIHKPYERRCRRLMTAKVLKLNVSASPSTKVR